MAAAAKKTTAKTNDEGVTSPFVNDEFFKSADDYTAAAKEQFDVLMQTFTSNSDEMREKTTEAFDELRSRFETAQKRAMDVNADLVEAARNETTEAVQFANNLVKANSFADALDIQRTYWTNLFETRMKHARELADASVETTRETFTPVSTDFGSFFNAKAYENFFRFPGSKA